MSDIDGVSFALGLDSQSKEAAQETIRGASSNDRDNCLLIGQDAHGFWVVRDKLGLKGGLFRSREDAWHFARGEACVCKLAIMTAEGQLDLSSGI